MGKTRLYFYTVGQFKAFGEPNPADQLAGEGFENGDTLSSIDVLPTLTPDISTFTSAGVYPFYFANGTDNYYELVSDTADFIVNKRMLSVAADTVTMTFGDLFRPLPTALPVLPERTMNLCLMCHRLPAPMPPGKPARVCTRSMWRVARTRIIILNILPAP